MASIVGILNRSECRKRAMLVVDDSEANRVAIQALFEAEFNVMQADSGREGLNLLSMHQEEIAVILLDTIMPQMDGSEFLAIKNHMSGVAEIPVIIFSSDRREDSQISMLQSGVNDYITKPFVPEVVYRRVKNVLEYQSRFTEIVSQYRQIISRSLPVKPDFKQKYLTLEEMRVLIELIRSVFDVVRVVDPMDTSVISIEEDNTLQKEPYQCFCVWNKENRCENCTSTCALQSNCQMTKYEFIENDIFYVVSRPVEIVLDNDKTIRVILEIVSHVSDSLMSQECEGVSIRQIMESTYQKIYCDPLTSAYNRRYLYEMLFLNQGRNKMAKQVAIIMMDMNGFKEINDTQGHAEGDRILFEVTKKLQGMVRQSDAIVRYGGDEFLIILTNCKKDQLEKKIKSFSQAINQVSYGTDCVYYASAKFGWSYADMFEPNRVFLEKMIQKADEDMYQVH